MTNAMDGIIIRFGGKKITAEERFRIEKAKKQLKSMEELGCMANFGVFKKRKKELQKIINQDLTSQELPLADFLKLDENNLSEKERQIQKLLICLYRLNDNTPPIYKRFPVRNNPLVIDCTTISFEGTGGIYKNNENMILVSHQNYNDGQLMDVLAHELKHAEQWIDSDTDNFNMYQVHQIKFLKEAQAYACGNWVRRQFEEENPQFMEELSIEEKFLRCLFAEELNRGIASKDMAFHLESFFDNEPIYRQYKDEYDKRLPIFYSDKGLTRIPDVFGIEKKDEVKILKILNERTPKRARTPNNIALQAFYNQDVKTLRAVVPMKDKKGEYLVSDETILQIMVSECYKNLNMFMAMHDSGRLNKADYEDLLGSVLHFSENEEMSEKEINGRKKVFKTLLSLKDKKGDFLIQNQEIEKCIYFAETWEEGEGLAFVKYAKNCMQRMRPQSLQKMKDNHTR